MDGTESDHQSVETGLQSPTSSKDGSLIIAPIQVIMNFSDESDESEHEEEQPQVRKKKKTKGQQKKEPKADKTAMLTKTFGQAIRLINEAKVLLASYLT